MIAFHAIMLSVVVPSVNRSITELDTRGTTRRQDGLLKRSVQHPQTKMTLWRKGDNAPQIGDWDQIKGWHSRRNE
jgi:hypothetical protein